ncbi:MAG TPA: hypothetical protein VFV01_08070 [Spirillospora sp.]|nr:hypothetical protein [Spirillospora sp.]
MAQDDAPPDDRATPGQPRKPLPSPVQEPGRRIEGTSSSLGASSWLDFLVDSWYLLWDSAWHYAAQAWGFVVSAAVGGVVGNRVDAGVVEAYRRLRLGGRRPRANEHPEPLTRNEAVAAAISAAAERGYRIERLRFIACRESTGPPAWDIVLRIAWTRRHLLIHVPAHDPEQITVVRTPPPGRQVE